MKDPVLNPCAEMVAAFEARFEQKWNSHGWKQASAIWAEAWHAAKGTARWPATPTAFAQVKNPFHRMERRQQFESILTKYAGKDPEFFDSQGHPNRSNTTADLFWRGYEGEPCLLLTESLPIVAFRAGREVKRSESKKNAQS